MSQPTRRTCGAHDEHRRLLTEDPTYVAARSDIETLARSYNRNMERASRVGITRIPVVVHVVWNTAAQNISDAQIRSQIDVLNRDFRGTNPDISQVPAVWRSVAADARIEFFLATTDPNGNPTTGITRRQTQTASFPTQGNPVKFAATGGTDAWPADRYLNIWVCQLGSGLLGYAQFPGGPANTDGAVILHSAFGTTGTAAAPFNRGRTATHEIGHWLNLFHIWGDDGSGCNGSDEVSDTPNAAGPNTGCPTFPSPSCGNGPNGDMFMNYMDYTDDACMFMFTAAQMARMQATLDGPRASIGTQIGDLPLALPIFAKHSRKVFDVEGGSTANGARLIQWGHHGEGNQLFRVEPAGGDFVRLIAQHSGRVLDVEGASTASGAQIIQWDWHGGANQLFRMEHVGGGYYRLTARHSDKALDVEGASTASGARLIQWDWHGGDNQRWRLLSAPLIARHSGKALDVEGASTASGARLIQWDWHGGDNQLFRIEPAGGGYYRLTAEHSGKVLDVEGASTTSDAQIIQWEYHGGGNQLFRIEPVGDGHYRLVARHSGKVLDVTGASGASGARLIQWDWHGGDNQKWKF